MDPNGHFQKQTVSFSRGYLSLVAEFPFFTMSFSIFLDLV